MRRLRYKDLDGFDPTTVAVEHAPALVDAIDGVTRSHRPAPVDQGRTAHNPGLFVKGVFEPDPAARRHSRSAIFEGDEVPATVRLSPMGLMGLHDSRDLHGFAVKFAPPGDVATDLVALNITRFPYARSDDFGKALVAMDRGLAAATFEFCMRTPMLAAAGRVSPRALGEIIGAYWDKPDRLARLRYYGVHTFFLENEKGRRTPARWHWCPSSDLRSGCARSIRELYQDLAFQLTDLGRGETSWDLMLELPWKHELMSDWPRVPPETRRRLADPTRRWKRPVRVRAGRFRFDAVLDARPFEDPPCKDAEGNSVPCKNIEEYDRMLFNPLQLGDGIYPSEDEVLRARGGAYVEAHMRRTA